MSERISANRQRRALLESLQQPEGKVHVEKPDPVLLQSAAGKVTGSKSTKPRGAKWSLDPPPIYRFIDADNPNIFMIASCERYEDGDIWTETDSLWGDLAASLFKMKLPNDSSCTIP
jgi:hypothetical protein